MTPTRREEQRQETYEEILQTARKQIGEQGAPNLSLRAIAREMGMTAPALYRYFENRDALVTVLIQLAYQSLTEALVAAREAHVEESSAAQLMAVGRAYRDWGLAHPEDYALIFGTPIPGYEAPPESTVPLARTSLGVLIEVLIEGQARGEFSLPETNPQLNAGFVTYAPIVATHADALHVALRLWRMVHGHTSLELFNHFDMLLQDPAELFELELAANLNQLTNPKK